MRTMETRSEWREKEWQEQLNNLFPEGVQVTVLDEGDPVRFLTSKLTVVGMQDSFPVVCCFPVNMDKDFIFVIKDINEDVKTLVCQPDGPNIQLDREFSQERADALHELGDNS